MSNYRSCRYTSNGEVSHRYKKNWESSGPTGQMLKGPAGTWDFYDEIQASRLSNYRSHRYTSDREGSQHGERTEHHGWVTAGPIGIHRMEKGPIARRKDRAKTSMMNCKHHGWVIWQIRWVTVGPIGTHQMKKGPIARRKNWQRLLWQITSITDE
jgi:hypothetical protein